MDKYLNWTNRATWLVASTIANVGKTTDDYIKEVAEGKTIDELANWLREFIREDKTIFDATKLNEDDNPEWNIEHCNFREVAEGIKE
jgi:hypothetical protein